MTDTLTTTIDCNDRPTRELNREVRAAIAAGVRSIRLANPMARHNLGVALPEGVTLVIDGPAGYYPGGLNDGATVEVKGGAGWGAAESMRDGTVVIDGDAGNAVAASIRGGTVVVRGDASTRAGIALKGGTLVVGGNAGPQAAFLAQKGSVIVCGDAHDGVAESMYDATVFVGGSIGERGADVVEADVTPEDRARLAATLDRWSLDGPDTKTFRKLVSGRALWNFHRDDVETWKAAL
jgi:glutamate synthase domain-containing protein 3